MYGFTLKLLGWKLDYKVPKEYSRCVLIGAPHTSNWDLFYTLLSFKALKIPYKFTIKKQWFRFPFNLIMLPLGGVPIDTKGNSKNGTSNVDFMANFFNQLILFSFVFLDSYIKIFILFLNTYKVTIPKTMPKSMFYF